MKKLLRRIVSLCLALVLAAALLPSAALAAGAPPTQILDCSSSFGYDFVLTFGSADQPWLEAITAVTVDGTAYQKGSSSFSVWNNDFYYVRASDSQLTIGEGGVAASGSTCVISADGYADLTLLLDKTSHSASISPSDAPCQHQGGTATCLQRAVCELCGREYGELGPHNYNEAGLCTVCGTPRPALPVAPTVTVGSDNYYLVFNISTPGYAAGITGVSVNGTPWSEQSFRMALNGAQYYKDAENNQLFFAPLSNTPLQSGDLITITNPNYEDVKLKLTIAGSTVTLTPADESTDPGDEYTLHVRLVGSFEAALVNQSGYDAISSASTNITQNKNSSASVEAALLPTGQQPQESDWAPLHTTGINVVSNGSAVNLDPNSGMAGVYSKYDSSVTLAGVPTQAGEYPITVTITDDQGRTATSNALLFRVYSGQERLVDQLTYANSTQTADGKYMYDMTPWKSTAFNGGDEVVTVPKDIKAWYGSHTSGTYGELGYAVPQGADTTQTLVVPAGCNLTLVNMDVLSSVRILVQNGGVLSLRDSVVQGLVEVQSGGSFSMNYDSYNGTFLTGASVNGTILMQDGSTLTSSKIYSNTNFIATGSEVRRTTAPVLVVNGKVTLNGQVFLRGDEAPTGTDPATGTSYTGQNGVQVNGTLTLTEGSVLAAYGGGRNATTSNGGSAVILNGGSITGPGKLIAIGGSGTFGNGGSAVTGSGTISAANVFAKGGSSYFPKAGSTGGQALAQGVTLAGTSNRSLTDGSLVTINSEDPDSAFYWRDVTTTPDLSIYAVAANAPGETDGGNGGEITPTPTPSATPSAAPSAEPSTAPTAEPSSKTGSSSGKKPTATAVPSSAQAAPAAASPKTGDGSHTEVWSALTLLCMAGLFLGLRKAKRN